MSGKRQNGPRDGPNGRGGGNNGKKSKKQYLQSRGQMTNSNEHWSQKNKDKAPLNSGLKGFLFTCDTMKDAQCTREALDMLDEKVQEMYPEEYDKVKEGGAGGADGAAGGGVADMQAELDRERASMEQVARQMFGVVKTTLRGLVFIRAKADWIDPNGVSQEILETIQRTRTMKTRFTLRILPVETTTFASVEAVCKGAQPLIAKHFPESMPKTYAFVYKSRGNNVLHRVDLFPQLAALIPRVHKVELKTPDLHFIIEVMTNTVMLSVVRNYNELGKYNLFSACETEEEKASRIESERKISARSVAKKVAEAADAEKVEGEGAKEGDAAAASEEKAAPEEKEKEGAAEVVAEGATEGAAQ